VLDPKKIWKANIKD